MGLVFEWNQNKANSNFIKHNVSFEEATTVFADNRSITIDNPLHSLHEKRFVTIGISANEHILVVVHTERGEKIRIISARPASRKERKQYQKK